MQKNDAGQEIYNFVLYYIQYDINTITSRISWSRYKIRQQGTRNESKPIQNSTHNKITQKTGIF